MILSERKIAMIISCAIIIISVAVTSSTTTECVAIISPNFENCSSSDQNLFGGLSQECSNEEYCGRNFTISYVQLQPYQRKYERLLPDILSYCCGACESSRGPSFEVENLFPDVSYLNKSSINSSDFVFPILGQSDGNELYGHKFLPIIDVPTAVYIRARRSRVLILKHVLRACVDLWPVLTICLLMAVISGFIAWIIETWKNEEEFRRSFCCGLFDGFWWSFVTMTTIGYGDKTPKSALTRLYSIAWILAGITICSLFTGTITTELAKAIKPSEHNMSGSRVGVLRYRLYDASVVARHGGILHESKSADAVEGVVELVEELKLRNIEGLLLDKHTYLYVYRAMESLESFFFYDTVQRNIHAERSDGPAMSYGLIIKNPDDFMFFKKFLTDNQLYLETCKSLGINVITKKEEGGHDHGIFTPNPRGLFWPALICTLSVVGLILVFGSVYDIYRRRLKCFGCQCAKIADDVGKVETFMLTQDRALPNTL